MSSWTQTLGGAPGLCGFPPALPFKGKWPSEGVMPHWSQLSKWLTTPSGVGSTHGFQEIDGRPPVVYVFKPIPCMECYYLCPETMAVMEFLFCSWWSKHLLRASPGSGARAQGWTVNIWLPVGGSAGGLQSSGGGGQGACSAEGRCGLS